MGARLIAALRELEPTTFVHEEQERRRVRALDRALMRGRSMPVILAGHAPPPSKAPGFDNELHYCPRCHGLHPFPICAGAT